MTFRQSKRTVNPPFMIGLMMISSMSALRISVSGQLKPATHSEQRYFNEQGGLGQQPGAGAVSAANGTDAKQPRITVTKMILRMVFMFFSCG